MGPSRNNQRGRGTEGSGFSGGCSAAVGVFVTSKTSSKPLLAPGLDIREENLKP